MLVAEEGSDTRLHAGGRRGVRYKTTCWWRKRGQVQDYMLVAEEGSDTRLHADGRRGVRYKTTC